jgi:hypothetical protein
MYYTSLSLDKFDLDVLEIVGINFRFGESTCFVIQQEPFDMFRTR